MLGGGVGFCSPSMAVASFGNESGMEGAVRFAG